MSRHMIKPTKWHVHPEKTQISLGIQSDKSLHCAPNVSSCGQWRLWSDWANAQADLNLCWSHSPFCWFCHAVAHTIMCPKYSDRMALIRMILLHCLPRPVCQNTYKWAASWQNQQNGMCAQRRLRPARHLPSLIRVFTVRMKKAWVLSNPLSTKQRPSSDWADAQADLSLCWGHSHFVGFVMRQLNYYCNQWWLSFNLH